MRVFCYETVRLLVAHGPKSVDLVDFHHNLLFSLRPHMIILIWQCPINAGYSVAKGTNGFARFGLNHAIFPLSDGCGMAIPEDSLL